MKIETKRLGMYLRAARLKAGFSAATASMLIGLRSSNLSDFENGKKPFCIKHLKRVAEVYGCDVLGLVRAFQKDARDAILLELKKSGLKIKN